MCLPAQATPSGRAVRARTTAALATSVAAAVTTLVAALRMAAMAFRAHVLLERTRAALATKSPGFVKKEIIKLPEMVVITVFTGVPHPSSVLPLFSR